MTALTTVKAKPLNPSAVPDGRQPLYAQMSTCKNCGLSILRYSSGPGQATTWMHINDVQVLYCKEADW